MTWSEFVTLDEIFKYLDINTLHKYVIGRNEAICQLSTLCGIASFLPMTLRWRFADAMRVMLAVTRQ